MNYHFPIDINQYAIAHFSFSKWSNTMNVYDELKIQLELPSVLSLHRADTICPAPKMPMVDLGYFKDKLGKIEVIIQASAMQHEIALEDYYAYFAGVSKETIVGQRLIDDNPDGVDLLTVKTFPDGQTWVTRRTGCKLWMGKGVFVITLNFACEKSVYNEYADLFYYMLNSFKLLNTPEYTMAEELRLFAKKYPLDFGTYIPFSWREGNNHVDTLIDMRSTFRKQYRGVVSGILNINSRKIKADEHVSREVLLTTYLASYIKQGLVINQIQFYASEKKSKLDVLEECNHHFTIDQNGTQVSLNLRIFLAERKGCWFYMDVIGLDKDQDFEIWAINKRAFSLAIDYLKTI